MSHSPLSNITKMEECLWSMVVLTQLVQPNVPSHACKILDPSIMYRRWWPGSKPRNSHSLIDCTKFLPHPVLTCSSDRTHHNSDVAVSVSVWSIQLSGCAASWASISRAVMQASGEARGCKFQREKRVFFEKMNKLVEPTKKRREDLFRYAINVFTPSPDRQHPPSALLLLVLAWRCPLLIIKIPN